jgi:hypothetical protein
VHPGFDCWMPSAALCGGHLTPQTSLAADTRARCFAQFSEWYGRDLVQPQQIDWDKGSAPWRLFTRPVCGVPGLGCLYL